LLATACRAKEALSSTTQAVSDGLGYVKSRVTAPVSGESENLGQAAREFAEGSEESTKAVGHMAADSARDTAGQTKIYAKVRGPVYHLT
jgi:hypothetical protein